MAVAGLQRMGRRPLAGLALACSASLAWLPGSAAAAPDAASASATATAGAGAATATTATAAAAAAAAASASASASVATATTTACRLPGVSHAALCGTLQRALDPQRPAGVQITIHYAVLPALARHKAGDPVFFFAGGPGQGAVSLAGPLAARFGRWGQRRDLVFVDQRGTGRSAPLRCADDDGRSALQPLAEALADTTQRLARLLACRQALQALPYGDLRYFTTTLAVADIDAVRQALGAARINAFGGSYGTRAVLEYMRQFPAHVRRAVLDGVAPPDMQLADAAGRDNQAALDAVLDGCSTEPTCAARHPALRAQWRALLASLPRKVALPHPLTGRIETVLLQRDTLLGLVRVPLYAPALAAALPAAIAAAADGDMAALLALASSLGSGAAGAVASGLHFSVVCAEDVGPEAVAVASGAAAATRHPGASRPPASRAVAGNPSSSNPPASHADANDFGNSFASPYAQACASWPRGTVPAAFYRVPPATAPVWLLSGGHDPVTPPRHGQQVAQALGALARHTVVPQAGHGVSGLACVRDALGRFITAETDSDALAVPATVADCAAALPRALAFVPPGSSAGPRPPPPVAR